MKVNSLDISRLITHGRAFFAIAITLTLLAGPEAAFAAAGDLDSTFGNGGKVKTDIFRAREALRRLEVTLREFDMTQLDREFAMFYDLYHRSLSHAWGFAPVTEGEVCDAGRAYRALTLPELTCVAEAAGRPVAVTLGLLDFNPLIRRLGPGLPPPRGPMTKLPRSGRGTQ